jgi:transposase-like protein
MSGHGEKFGRKREAAVAALLTQRTAEDAARSIGIGPATLRRWQKEPEFDAAFRAAKLTAYRQTIARMHQLSGAAVSTLGKVMLDPTTPPATKVRAADSILNHTAKAIEIEEIDARVKALEDATDAKTGGRRQ